MYQYKGKANLRDEPHVVGDTVPIPEPETLVRRHGTNYRVTDVSVTNARQALPRFVSELQSLPSDQFDFRKLIRLCEEINVVYSDECYFATAMLVRSVLDHVPPVFGKNTFSEVANNYGGRSFKELMQHFEQHREV